MAKQNETPQHGQAERDQSRRNHLLHALKHCEVVLCATGAAAGLEHSWELNQALDSLRTARRQINAVLQEIGARNEDPLTDEPSADEADAQEWVAQARAESEAVSSHV